MPLSETMRCGKKERITLAVVANTERKKKRLAGALPHFSDVDAVPIIWHFAKRFSPDLLLILLYDLPILGPLLLISRFSFRSCPFAVPNAWRLGTVVPWIIDFREEAA